MIFLPLLLAGVVLEPSLEIGFEGGRLPPELIAKSPRPDSITVKSEIVRSGKFAARFELKGGDEFFGREGKDGFRAELKDPLRAEIGREYWYAFSFYIPHEFPTHENRLVLGQWNAEPDAGEKSLDRSPPLSQRYSNGVFSIALRHCSEKIQNENAPKQTIFSTRELKRGQWNDFVYRIKWSYQEGGFIRTWINGVEVLHYKGPTTYNDDQGPYFKFGLYRDDVPDSYVIFFDDYRRGLVTGESSSLFPQ